MRFGKCRHIAGAHTHTHTQTHRQTVWHITVLSLVACQLDNTNIMVDSARKISEVPFDKVSQEISKRLIIDKYEISLDKKFFDFLMEHIIRVILKKPILVA